MRLAEARRGTIRRVLQEALANRHAAGWAVTVLVVAGLMGAPAFLTPYEQSVLQLVFLNITLALSWNLIGGYTGYFSFGHIAFFGIGAYAAALAITQIDLHWLLASLLGAVIATAAAFVIGFPCLRMRGPTFAIMMLAFSQALRLGTYIFEDYTGGGYGLSLPPTSSLLPVYYAFGLAALAIALLTWWISHSTFGVNLIAIRDDEGAAEAVGIDTTREKTKAFLLSALFPGFCGGVYVWYLSYIHPDEAFSLKINVSMIVMALFGGAGTLLGPIIGAVSLFSISELLWARYPILHELIFGLLVIVLVVFLPNGVLGSLSAWFGNGRNGRGRQ